MNIEINGAKLVADPSGALWWEAHRLLAFADLHFEKGSAYAGKGALLPPYDTRATLARVSSLIAHYDPAIVVCLGDSFHDGEGPGRLDRDDAGLLASLAQGRDWVWIAGNHDPELPEALGGRVVGELNLGPLSFRHEALVMTAPGEISGHFHPKAAVKHRGRRLSGRCFAGDGHRLVLPAFGAYTGGLNVRDPAIAGLFLHGFTVWLIGQRRIFAFPATRLA
jgi:uncharacterized protein